MSVDAIGSVVGSGSSGIKASSLNQSDLLKIFLTQLTYQDPLNPVDSREFLAQLAQFTNVQQTQELSQNLMGLLSVQSVSQSIGLIGKTVQVLRNGQELVGTVSTLQFQSGQPLLTLQQSDGTFLQGIRLSDIDLVR